MCISTHSSCVTNNTQATRFYSQCDPLNNFHLACYEFQLCLETDIELPIYKGASFHGALGQALAKISTRTRDYFYNPTPPKHWQESQKPPRPYILIPPLDERTHFRVGETLSLGIVLYGSALNYLLLIFAALEHLGEYMGLGQQRGRFHVQQVKQITSIAAITLYQNNQWLGQTNAISAADFFTDIANVSTVRIKHSTRLRLKANNELLRTAPPFDLFMHRLLGRINALASLYGNGIVITPEEKHDLLALAETIVIDHSNLSWQDWQRYSQRSQSTMPFGGLVGETVYRGELTAFVPWLALGQWIGLGGKTSFGLGQYTINYGDNNETT